MIEGAWKDEMEKEKSYLEDWQKEKKFIYVPLRLVFALEKCI